MSTLSHNESKSVFFHTENVSYTLPNQSLFKKWITHIIVTENYQCGTINFIFCSDEYLLAINQKFLKHDYLTDVITFDYCDKHIISGDIFVSIERVEDNCNNLKNKFIDEISRVMAHGVLHLIGYQDKSQAEKLQIREKEDYYLSLRPF